MVESDMWVACQGSSSLSLPGQQVAHPHSYISGSLSPVFQGLTSSPSSPLRGKETSGQHSWWRLQERKVWQWIIPKSSSSGTLPHESLSHCADNVFLELKNKTWLTLSGDLGNSKLHREGNNVSKNPNKIMSPFGMERISHSKKLDWRTKVKLTGTWPARNQSGLLKIHTSSRPYSDSPFVGTITTVSV